jgi:hypothetical protein
MNNRAPWINLVNGILIFASPYAVHPTTSQAEWNYFLSGIAIGLIAFTTICAHGNVARNYWSALNVLAGLWLIVSLALIATDPAMAWAQVSIGVMTVVTALASLSSEHAAARSRIRS